MVKYNEMTTALVLIIQSYAGVVPQLGVVDLASLLDDKCV